MVAWIILSLLMFEGVDSLSYDEVKDIEKARQAYKAQLSELALQKAVKAQPASVAVAWTRSTSSGAAVHYIVTGPNCVPCLQRKAYLTAHNIPFQEISVSEALTLGKDRSEQWFRLQNKYIPFEFDHTPVMSAVQVNVSGEPSTAVLLQLLADHVASQTAPPAYSSFINIDVDVPDKLPSIISGVMTKQSWSNDYATVTWAGKRTLTVDKTVTTFSPPIELKLKKLGVSYSTALQSINLSADGKSAELVLIRCPNITFNFK